MNMKVDYFDNRLELMNDIINVIEIENKKYFYRFVNDLHMISNTGYSDSINFFDNTNNELNMNGKIKIYLDFFDFGFDSKKCINDISKYVNENIDEVSRDSLLSQYKKILNSYNKILNNIDLPLSIDNEISIENVTKSMKISINSKVELLDNLLLLIDLEKVLRTNNILIFVNLKQYLNKDELMELYKYSIYNQVKMVLIDSQSYGTTLNYEKKLIIDENLEEFML